MGASEGHRWLRAIVLLAGVLPFVAIVVPSLAPTMTHVFHSVCHQLPERSLIVGGVPMIVCSRCAGLYAGVVIGALTPMPMPLFERLRTTLFIVLGVAVTEVLLQDLHVLVLSHGRRLATGFALGWVAAAATSRALSATASPADAKIA